MTISLTDTNKPPRQRLDPLTWFGIIVLLFLLFIAVFPTLVTGQDYAKQNLRNRLKAPAWTSEGSWANPLGTDHLGRDLWARIVVGARVSLLIAGGAVLVAGTTGTVLGLISGYLGGY